MLGIGSPEDVPGMDQRTLLRVQFVKPMVESGVPAPFIAIVPDHHRRVVHVAHDHFAGQYRPCFGIIGRLPSGKFIQHKKSMRVANLKEMLVGRIMRHPHGIHVHLPDELYVFDAFGLPQCPAALGPERVAIDSLHPDFHPVYVKSIPLTELHRAETKPFPHGMKHLVVLHQAHFQQIEIGKLGVPGVNIVQFRRQQGFCALDFRSEGIAGLLPCQSVYLGADMCGAFGLVMVCKNRE